MYLKQLKLVTSAALPSLYLMLVNKYDIEEDAIPNDLWHTGDVKNATRERGGHRGFSFRKRYTNIGSFQSTAIIGPVSAKPAAVVNTLKLLYKFMLFVR
jgi:hypothetical protein